MITLAASSLVPLLQLLGTAMFFAATILGLYGLTHEIWHDLAGTPRRPDSAISDRKRRAPPLIPRTR